jgi:hypothetical protein
MINPSLKRFTLPFAPQKSREPFNAEVEAAGVYALAELERMKGGGLIVRQPQEKLAFLAKIGYPLWLYPKNEFMYIFDGLKNSEFATTYFELPSTQAFQDALKGNSNTKEEFTAFLSDHSNYFSQPKKEKLLTINNLIVDVDFRKELGVYRHEAVEVTGSAAGYALLQPSLEEAAVSSSLTEIANLQANARQDSERLAECLRLLNRTTNQFVTELDYAAEAFRDEANAKIRAQLEFINPKIAALNGDYKRRIAQLTRSFDVELEKLGKAKTKNERAIESDQVRVRQYQREAEAQASKHHQIYEKRWKEKAAQTRKDLNGLEKELKRTEKKIKNLDEQKKSQVANLQFQLEQEIKRLRQPVLDLEVFRDTKILVFRREIERLFKLERPVADGLGGAIKLGDAVNAKLDALGFIDSSLKSPALFYLPYYAACYEAGLSRRFTFLPPSMANAEGFGSRLRGAFGISKFRQLLVPRFPAISELIGKLQTLVKHDAFMENQIVSLGEKNNALTSRSARNKIVDGMTYLRNEGWLSEKEYQIVSDGLART